MYVQKVSSNTTKIKRKKAQQKYTSKQYYKTFPDR